jgi:hypothetical protein
MVTVLEMESQMSGLCINSPNPTNLNGTVEPNVILSLPNITDPTSICGTLSIYYSALVESPLLNLATIGELANQALRITIPPWSVNMSGTVTYSLQ